MAVDHTGIVAREKFSDVEGGGKFEDLQRQEKIR